MLLNLTSKLKNLNIIKNEGRGFRETYQSTGYIQDENGETNKLKGSYLKGVSLKHL